jgi:predicted Abi (CAAX) family protease
MIGFVVSNLITTSLLFLPNIAAWLMFTIIITTNMISLASLATFMATLYKIALKQQEYKKDITDYTEDSDEE